MFLSVPYAATPKQFTISGQVNANTLLTAANLGIPTNAVFVHTKLWLIGAGGGGGAGAPYPQYAGYGGGGGGGGGSGYAVQSTIYDAFIGSNTLQINLGLVGLGSGVDVNISSVGGPTIATLVTDGGNITVLTADGGSAGTTAYNATGAPGGGGQYSGSAGNLGLSSGNGGNGGNYGAFPPGFTWPIAISTTTGKGGLGGQGGIQVGGNAAGEYGYPRTQYIGGWCYYQITYANY